MRIDLKIGAGLVLVTMAATSALLGPSVRPQRSAAQIRLVDNTVAMDPRTDGVTMTTTSGWRSPQFQQRLLDNAVTTYGGQGADQWLIDNGSPFGLCRICANELWHFELATDAAGTSVWPHDGTGLGCNAFDHRT